MPTFDIGKDAGDIQEGKLMDEGWYEMELVVNNDGEGPRQEANAAMRDEGPEAEGAGYNIVLDLMMKLPDQPEFDGRTMRCWMGLPREGDKKKFTPQGQSVEDSKLERIVQNAAAFSGEKVEGAEVSFDLGNSAMIYVDQQIPRGGGDPQNSINIFTTFRPVEA
jgi:hypothetical protein